MPLTAEIIEISLPHSMLRTRDTWDSLILLSGGWSSSPGSPPLPTFLKVNFNDSVTNGTSGAKLMIRDPDSRLITAEGVRLVDTSVPRMELRAAWEGITYARIALPQTN